MNRIFTLLTAGLVCLGAAACNNSPQGGTPGTKDTFTVSAPTMTTNIKQGDRQTVDLTLNRGTDFKKKVDLTVSAPKELKVDLGSKSVAAGDPSKVTLTVEAAKDTPVGDHTIKVTATPESGAATSVDVKVKVEEKK